MGSVTGTLQKIQKKDSGYGEFSLATINGEIYAAFKQQHYALQQLKIGENIEFSYEDGGKGKRITSIGGSSSSSPTSPDFPSVASEKTRQSGKSWVPKDPKEFNYMMATRYALDALIAGIVPSAHEGAKLVKEIFDQFELIGGDSPIEQQIATLTKELSIDTSGRPWNEYLSKRFKGQEPTQGQMVDLVDMLLSVKKGKLKFQMTPDGHLATAMP